MKHLVDTERMLNNLAKTIKYKNYLQPQSQYTIIVCLAKENSKKSHSAVPLKVTKIFEICCVHVQLHSRVSSKITEAVITAVFRSFYGPVT